MLAFIFWGGSISQEWLWALVEGFFPAVLCQPHPFCCTRAQGCSGAQAFFSVQEPPPGMRPVTLRSLWCLGSNWGLMPWPWTVFGPTCLILYWLNMKEGLLVNTVYSMLQGQSGRGGIIFLLKYFLVCSWWGGRGPGSPLPGCVTSLTQHPVGAVRTGPWVQACTCSSLSLGEYWAWARERDASDLCGD